ncbi:MAG: hypothetical protein ACXW1Z_23220 [Methylobacter sp.]
MNRIILSLFLYLISTIAVANEPLTLISNNDYQISIPHDWVEIPTNVLQPSVEIISRAIGHSQTYEYGYQSANAKTWFQFPYVLVKIERNGRVHEGQLKQYKQFHSDFNEAAQEFKNNTGDLVTDMTQGETLYDESLRVLWSSTNMDVKGIGKVTILLAAKLTEYGSIQFYGYALEQDFIQYKPMFRQMVQSITPPEQDVYKPQIIDNAPTIFGINLGETAISFIVGGLIGGLLGLPKWFKRKKNS